MVKSKIKINLLMINEQIVMSSRDIAEITSKQHKNVLAVCREMIEKSVSAEIQLSEYVDSTGRTLPQYLLNKRDSIVLVARLSPEFTARIVDRWQELENEKINSNFELKEEHSIAYKGMQEVNKQKGATSRWDYSNLGKATKGRNKQESYAIRSAILLEAIKNFQNIKYHNQLRVLGASIKEKVLTTIEKPKKNKISCLAKGTKGSDGKEIDYGFALKSLVKQDK